MTLRAAFRVALLFATGTQVVVLALWFVALGGTFGASMGENPARYTSTAYRTLWPLVQHADIVLQPGIEATRFLPFPVHALGDVGVPWAVVEWLEMLPAAAANVALMSAVVFCLLGVGSTLFAWRQRAIAPAG